MNQGTKAEHSETAWHALTIQSLGKESLYWMSFGPPFLSSSLPCCTLWLSFWGQMGYVTDLLPSFTSLWKQVQLYSLKVSFLDIFNSLNWTPIPFFVAVMRRIKGRDESSMWNCIKQCKSNMHKHITGSYLSILQMEVLWTTTCTKMRIEWCSPIIIQMTLRPAHSLSQLYTKDRKKFGIMEYIRRSNIWKNMYYT